MCIPAFFFAMTATLPHLGFGLGLRPVHYPYIFEHRPKVDWFEIISENFMDTGGRARRNLDRVRSDYPVVMHGVALSIGTVDPLNSEYLVKLKTLADAVQPAWISDHLCWTGVAHRTTHDLLPVPYTEEALRHIIARIGRVQDFLGRPIALENPSTYLEFNHSSIPEAEFIAAMARESGCQLLLDVNNVYVTCYNHRLDPRMYLDALPMEQVVQVHLSGHSNHGHYIIDTHDDHVIDPVWSLYRYATHKAGRRFNTMIEWDDKIPEFPVLMAELDRARHASATADQYAPLPELAQPPQLFLGNRSPQLQDTQQRFQESILQGDTSDAGAWVRSKQDFAPEDQLAVYVNAYRYRLFDATAEDYPVLKTYLGDEAFERLIDGFIEANPSAHFNIARYTLRLPEYLHHQLDDPFANALAQLESTLARLADAAETAPLRPEQLAELTPDAWMAYRLRPRAALRLMRFEHAVNDYYLAVQEGESPPIIAQPSYLAVFRHDDTVWRMPLDAEEYRLLQALFGGCSIAQALETVPMQAEGEARMANLSHWFGRWMRNGLLAA